MIRIGCKNGTAFLDIGAWDTGMSIGLQSDGKVLIGGFAGNWPDIIIVRLLESGIVDIPENYFESISAYIYPNPVVNNFTLDYILKTQESVTLRLFSSSGEFISVLSSNKHQRAGHYRETVQLNTNLKPGFYVLKVETPNSFGLVKFLKQ